MARSQMQFPMQYERPVPVAGVYEHDNINLRITMTKDADDGRYGMQVDAQLGNGAWESIEGWDFADKLAVFNKAWDEFHDKWKQEGEFVPYYTRKERALALHLDIDPSEVEEGGDAFWDNAYKVGRKEFRVLTDDEADDEARESIENDLWAFKSEFIISHSVIPRSDQTEAVVRAISKVQETLCEGAGPVVKALLGDNLDAFVEDAISEDGRGHFLASWDGEESEVEVDGTKFYIYQQHG